MNSSLSSSSQSISPPGLVAIYNLLRRIYPDQPNPLQVTALVKYWLNGPDPLDYISMYANEGDMRLGIVPHWHYVSCGLSDLYGDGRVHDVKGDDGPSGFGFELTFRLARGNEPDPPTWPAEMMQQLAKYVFNSENEFCRGDHVSWHMPLDYGDSFLRHMLITEDPQLPQINTPFGCVNFLQIVGICNEELHASQQWNGDGILELLHGNHATGGPWLVTDISRSFSVFDISPKMRNVVQDGMDLHGSDVAAVSARCWWMECSKQAIISAALHANNSQNDVEQPNSSLVVKRIHGANLHSRSGDRDGSLSQMSCYSTVSDLLRARPISDGLHLRFNMEAASFLMLAIRGRLAHSRHFTFKSQVAESAITFVSSSVLGTSVDERCPYAAWGTWLQILIPDDFLPLFAHDLEELNFGNHVSAPRQYVWPKRNLMISVVVDN